MDNPKYPSVRHQLLMSGMWIPKLSTCPTSNFDIRYIDSGNCLYSGHCPYSGHRGTSGIWTGRARVLDTKWRQTVFKHNSTSKETKLHCVKLKLPRSKGGGTEDFWVNHEFLSGILRCHEYFMEFWGATNTFLEFWGP